MNAIRIALSFALGLALVACGGGGGGSTPPPGNPGPVAPTGLDNTAFQGTYFFALLNGDAARSGFATFGYGTADGAGTFTYSGGVNQNGALGTVSGGTLAYTVAADGMLEIRVGGTLAARGGIGTDGRRAVAASVAPQIPAMYLFLRAEGSYTNGNLSGFYRTGSLAVAPNVAWISRLYEGTFDGNGMWGGPSEINTEGAVSSAIAGPALAYAVTGTGGLNWQADYLYTGQLAEGGAYGILGGDLVGGLNSSPGIAVLVREASGMTAASFSGGYWYVSLEREPTGPSVVAGAGTATADGAGVLTLAGTSNDFNAGTVNQAGSYVLTAEGRLTVNRSGGINPTENLRGGLAAGADFGFVAGGTLANANTALIVFIAK